MSEPHPPLVGARPERRSDLDPGNDPRRAVLEAIALTISAVVPAWFAASHVSNVPDAAHDDAVVRVVSFGGASVWHGLDALVAAPILALPIGARAARAALAAAVVLGGASTALYLLTRRLLAACAPSPRLNALVATVATLAVTLSAPWQIEGAIAGGGVLGALLVMAPLVPMSLEEKAGRRLPLAAGALGLALGYEPMVGLCALASVTAHELLARRSVPLRGAQLVRLGGPFLLGLLPLGGAIARAASGRGLAAERVSLMPWPSGGWSAASTPPFAAFGAEPGWLVVLLAMVGVLFAALVPRARPLAGALGGVALLGALATLLPVDAGPTRYAPVFLAAVAALGALAAVSMQAAVRAVAGAQVPFAKLSAAMVVLLELTFPVTAADAALARALERGRGAVTLWDEVAWGDLPTGAVLLIHDRRVMDRALASRARGVLRGDLALVPTYDLGLTLARRELSREPKLADLWRDVALSSRPEELSLSNLASVRPVGVVYDPAWDRHLARHLVPSGLAMRFEPEPRGASDRRRAIERARPARDRLAKAILSPTDPDLLALTVRLLRLRALAVVTGGDRVVVPRALEDITVFSPNDPFVAEVTRRLEAGKGAIDTKDLVP